ncbi:hypothetical protein [Streptomyces sp. NPDC005131]
MTSAKLTYANLRNTQLKTVTGVRLPAGATWNANTRWPAYLASLVAEECADLRNVARRRRHCTGGRRWRARGRRTSRS